MTRVWKGGVSISDVGITNPWFTLASQPPLDSWITCKKSFSRTLGLVKSGKPMLTTNKYPRQAQLLLQHKKYYAIGFNSQSHRCLLRLNSDQSVLQAGLMLRFPDCHH